MSILNQKEMDVWSSAKEKDSAGKTFQQIYKKFQEDPAAIIALDRQHGTNLADKCRQYRTTGRLPAEAAPVVTETKRVSEVELAAALKAYSKDACLALE